MSLFSFFRKKRVDLLEEELRKAREEAYRHAAEERPTKEELHLMKEFLHGEINNGITQEEVNAELKAIAGELDELGEEILKNARQLHKVS